jgi:hypothetical protein
MAAITEIKSCLLDGAAGPPPIPARRCGAICVGNVDARELAHLAIGSLHVSGTSMGPTGDTYARGR